MPTTHQMDDNDNLVEYRITKLEQQYAELGALTEEKPLSDEELANLKQQI